MRILRVEQGSVEWQMARLGIPTASKFDEIITPKTMKLSSSASKYSHALIAERWLGLPTEGGSSGYAQRGKLVEERARSYYELKRDVDVETVGFICRDDYRVGCSPDGLVGEDGLLEIKVPKVENHVGYLLDEYGIGYHAQVQGQLWITGRKWVDTLSYHPDMPPALVRIARDEAFITALSVAVDQFLATMDKDIRRLVEAGAPKKLAEFVPWMQREDQARAA